MPPGVFFVPSSSTSTRSLIGMTCAAKALPDSTSAPTRQREGSRWFLNVAMSESSDWNSSFEFLRKRQGAYQTGFLAAQIAF